MSVYSRSFPLLSFHLRYITDASTLAGENVLGSFSSEITLRRMVLATKQEQVRAAVGQSCPRASDATGLGVAVQLHLGGWGPGAGTSKGRSSTAEQAGERRARCAAPSRLQLFSEAAARAPFAAAGHPHVPAVPPARSSPHRTFCVGFQRSDGSSPLCGSSTGGCRMEMQTSPV